MLNYYLGNIDNNPRFISRKVLPEMLKSICLRRETIMDRAITTFFMLMSVDGKISTGASDKLDVDQDFPNIKGVRKDYLNLS